MSISKEEVDLSRMEPENASLEKEKHRPKPPIFVWVQHVFGGLVVEQIMVDQLKIPNV